MNPNPATGPFSICQSRGVLNASPGMNGGVDEPVQSPVTGKSTPRGFLAPPLVPGNVTPGSPREPAPVSNPPAAVLFSCVLPTLPASGVALPSPRPALVSAMSPVFARKKKYQNRSITSI